MGDTLEFVAILPQAVELTVGQDLVVVVVVVKSARKLTRQGSQGGPGGG